MTLKQYIHGENELKRIAMAEIKNVLPQLTQYLGKKIFTVDGGKAKAFVIEFIRPQPTPYPETFKGQKSHADIQGIYLTEKYGKLNLCVSICISQQNKPTDQYQGANYFRWDYTIGTMAKNDGKLEEISELSKIIDMHNLDEVLNEQEERKKIAEYENVLKQLETIRRTIKVSSDYIPKYAS